MAWQDYVNDKYSKKKPQQTTQKETPTGASPSAASGGSSVTNALRTLTAQVNANRKAEAGTWQNHINQRYGTQAAKQQAAQQNQMQQTNAQVRRLYDNLQAGAQRQQQARQESLALRQAQRAQDEWENQPAIVRATTSQPAAGEKPQRTIWDEWGGMTRNELEANVRPSETETIQQQRIRQVREAQATDEALARRQAFEDQVDSTIEQRENNAYAKETLQKMQGIGKLAGMVGNTISGAAQGIAQNKAAQGVAATIQSAGNALAKLYGEVNRVQGMTRNHALDEFNRQYPNVGSIEVRPELLQRVEEAANTLSQYGTAEHSTEWDPFELSAAFDDRIRLLREFSHPEELDQYYEDIGPSWALGTDRQADTEKELMTKWADDIKAQRRIQQYTDELTAAEQMNALSPEALELMQAAGGRYANTVQRYNNLLAEEQAPDDGGIGIRLELINGQLVPVQKSTDTQTAQGPDLSKQQLEFSIQRNWEDYKKSLRDEISQAETDQQNAKADAESTEEALRAAWMADANAERQTDYERALKEYTTAVSEFNDAQREDYSKAYQTARSQQESAPAYMQAYYRMLPYYDDFRDHLENPLTRPTAEERVNAQFNGEKEFLNELNRRDAMTDEELQKATYLRNTQGGLAMQDYLDSLEEELNRRVTQGLTERAREFGQTNPWAASITSTAANMANTLQGGKYVLGQIYKGLNHERLHFDENAPEMASGAVRTSLREGVTDTFGDSNWGKIGKFLYDTGMSGVVDSAINMAAFGPIGEYVMGLGAMVDGIRETKSNGGSDAQALIIGIENGAAESITEHLGFDRVRELFKLKGNAGKILNQIFSNVKGEFLEESATEIANSLTDWFVMGDQSEFEKLHDQYLKNNMSETEATWRALADIGKQVGLAGLGGALGGLVTGGGSAALGQAFNTMASVAAQDDISKLSKQYGNMAEAFENLWDGETMPGIYQRAFQALYDAGAQDLPMDFVQRYAGDIVGQLDEVTQQKIYQVGQNAAAAETQYNDGRVAAQTETIAAEQQAEQTEGQQTEQAETARPIETRTQETIQQAEQIANEPVVRTVDGINQTQAQVQTEERQQHRSLEEQIESYFEDQITPGVVRLYQRQKLTHNQRSQLRVLDAMGKHYGVEIDIMDSLAGASANGTYTGGRRIVVALDATENAYVQVAGHEMVHYIKAQDADAYQVLANMITDALQEQGMNVEQMALHRMAEYAKAGYTLNNEDAIEEIVAEALPTIFTDKEAVRQLVDYNPSLAQKIRDFILDFVETLRDIAFDYANASDRDEIMYLLGEKDKLTEIARTFDAALEVAGESAQARENRAREQGRQEAGRVDNTATEQAANVKREAKTEDATTNILEDKGIEVADNGKSAYYDIDKHSYKSFMESDYHTDMKETAKALADAIGVDVKDAERYIRNMESIAAMIGKDRERLDYEAEDIYSALKSNSEYIWTVDFSTLCKKRLLFTGTFDKIQSAMPNGILTENDVIEIRDMMAQKGYEVACAFCYVESRRKKNGQIINEFLKKYKAAANGNGIMTLGPRNRLKEFRVEAGYTPEIASFNTMEGYKDIIHNHPDVYEAYMYFMNARGTSKPKLIESMTDYRNSEILNQFKNPRAVEAMNNRGGLRIQSFSDFQTLNLLDMMQVITDMSRVGLKGQAYTKVPAFGRIFGGTGLKINLSLVAKGVDGKGNIIYDDVEGMPHDEAFDIRKKYSENVGTILVAGNDEVIKAAMADRRIDFIIPYHRSGWTKANEKKLGLDTYENYTRFQNEIVKATGKKSAEPIFPSEYWDYKLSGDENAQKYLDLCKERGLRPKFAQFAGQSGYWKMLIDFKMYDNKGNGAEQHAVKPEYNMQEAMRRMRKYDGSEGSLPVAQDIVDDFIAAHPEKFAPEVTKFSMKAPIERKGDLLAVHNISISKLRSTAERGGFIMPSVAVVKAEQGHDDFGEISILLKADAIDPAKDTRNRIYSQDAWTPTFFNSRGTGATNEEILNEMLGRPEKGGKVTHFEALIGRASKNFANFDQVRENSEQLREESLDSRQERETYYKEENAIIDAILSREGTTFTQRKNVENLVFEAAGVDRNTQSIKQVFAEGGGEITDEEAERLLNLYNGLSTLPTKYFEAKPRRIIGFDEIAAIVAPAEFISTYDEADEPDYGEPVDPEKYEVFEPFRQAGVPIYPYESWPGGKSRLEVLNSIDQPGVRFSLKDTSKNQTDYARVLAGVNGRPAITISGVNEVTERAAAAYEAQKAKRNGSNQSTEQEQRDQARQRFEARKDAQVANNATVSAAKGQTEAMKLARNILREYESQYSRTSLRDNMLALMGEIAKNGVSDDTLRESTQLARAIIEQSRHVDTTLRDQYKDLRKTLRETPIQLTSRQRQEAANIAGDYGGFRKSLFGTFNIGNNGKSLDAIWNEWSDIAPDLFPPDTREGDMVQQLVNVRGAFMPQVTNQYGMDIDGASTDLGLRMQEDILKAIGDDAGALEMEAAINELRRQYTDAINDERKRIKLEQRKAFDRIAAALREARGSKDEEAARRAMVDYRAQMKRIGAEQAEAQARLNYRLHYEDNRARASAYERIRKTSEALRRMLAKPDKNKHIPMAMQVDVLHVLEALDYSRNGQQTDGSRAWGESLRQIEQYLERQLDIQAGRRQDEPGHEGVYLSLTDAQIEQLHESIDTVLQLQHPIGQMNLDEINALSRALSMIHHIATVANETWTNQRHQTMDDLGEATIREMSAIRDNKAQDSNGLVRTIDNMLNLENLDAGSFFERMGGREGAAYSVYEELRDGQSQAYAKVREASEETPKLLGFTDKNRRERTRTIRNWAKEEHSFELPREYRDGELVTEKMTLTGTQLMELYALSRRPQALQHILTGGIRIEAKDGKIGNTRTWKIDEGQLNHMLDELTADQKETVHRLQGYLSGTVSEWGNDVTERMYQYRMFGEDTYWPIRSERGYMRTREQNGSILFNALTNAGFTKQTQDVVRNPIMVGDVIETFAGHVGDMATFAGLAMPVDDMLRWYNYASRDDEGRVAFSDSLKKQIERVMGKGGNAYLETLMDDLNGMGKKAPVSGFVNWAMSNYKRAAIMAKLRVVIQQPTAILRASAMINPKYFANAFRGVGRHTVEEMQEHSALAWWKGNGNYEIGTGASMKSIITGMQDSTMDDVLEALNAPAGKADDIGWAAIWQAVKKETKDRYPNLTVGSDAYWEVVTERFEAVAMQTQVVDTVLSRSAMMRSKDTLQKMATAFMSEPTRNFNLMRTAIGNLYGAIRSGNADERRRATGQVLRSAAAITAATALNAVMTAWFDAVKYYNPDDDEDEFGEQKGFWRMVGANWVADFTDSMNPLTNIPYIKDVYEIMQGGDVERMDMSAASRLYTAVRRAWDYVDGNSKSYTAWAAMKPLLTSIGDLTGMPISGLVANAELAINAAKPGAIRTKTETATLTGGYAALYDAIASGDTSKATRLRRELQGKGKSSLDIDTGVAKQLALNDDRIREYWEKRESGRTQGLKQLKADIMASGFTEEIVMKALNSYQSTIKSDAKAYYLKAVETGRQDKAEQYAAKLRSVGVADDEIASWTATKETEEEKLEMTAEYTKKNLYAAIRNGDATNAEIQDIVDSLSAASEAEDPMSGIRSGLSSEFKQDYIELIKKGKTSEANKLKKRLLAAGAKESTIESWEKEAKKK